MSSYKCLRDCHDGKETLYLGGQFYQIDPEAPCAVHFDLPPSLRKKCLAAEKIRREQTTRNQEARALAKAQGVAVADLAMIAAEESVEASRDTCNKAAPTLPAQRVTGKICECGREFSPKCNRQVRCPECKKRIDTEQNRERQEKFRKRKTSQKPGAVC